MKILRSLAATVVAAAMLTVVSPGTGSASGNGWYDRYVAMDAAFGDSIYTGPDSATLAWGESYVLNSYLDVYELSRDTRWLDKLVTHVDQIIANADDDDNDGYLGWSTSRYSPDEVLNTGFETAASGDSTMAANWTRWQTTSATARRTTDRASGAYGMQINSDGAAWRRIYQQLGTYEPNTVYDLTFRARTNGSAAGGRAHIIDRTTNTVLCSTAFTNTTWATHSTGCRTPSAAGHDLQLFLGHSDYQISGGSASFDDVTVKGRFPYIVHDGMIGTAIAKFARLVHGQPSLPATYAEQAATYRAFLEDEIVPRWESSPYIGNTWISTAGTYTQPPNFDSFSHSPRPANDYLPYNQSLAYGQMLLVLHQVNGDATYLDRARRTGQFFKGRLTLNGDAYTWTYSPQSTAVEDTSHANIDVGAARELYESGNVFTATDMQRFTNTLTQLMWNGSLTTPRVSKFVNGTGDESFSWRLVEWLEYAQWAKNIFPIATQQFQNPNNGAVEMLMLTRIMKWDRSKVVNQGFELATSFDATQPAQWNRAGSSASTAFRDPANAYEGRYGLTVRSVGGAAQQVNQGWEGWRANATYTLSFVGKVAGAAGGRVWVLNETTGTILANVPITTTDWTPVAVDFTSPSVATQVVRVYVGNTDPTVTGTAHLDAVKIRVAGDTW
ncbi:hypothetical protein PSH03_003818 [Micromonospora sp. PSH03]|uniref:carbohydrate binding domain-containing protein n=1 Tax=Micromonospora salmantinae TaxID=2911211 RepID=UPI001EE82457|nr:carbohydrate binding domain-containing protein [Micromonospora salmantinae]MCG5454656.1 hypothetical protein [Micromonospora salmantinae]